MDIGVNSAQKKENFGRYILQIEEDEYGFSLEYKNEKKETTEFFRRVDGKAGIPEKELLVQSPILWLMNLKLGKYEVEKC